MRTFTLLVALGALAGASGCGGGSGPEETNEPAASGPLLEPCMSAPAPEPVPAPVSQAGSSSVICHIPPGNHENAHTLTVGAAAVGAHLAHGDSLGPCGPPPPPPGTCAQRGDRCESRACCPGLTCLTADFRDCAEDVFADCNCYLLE